MEGAAYFFEYFLTNGNWLDRKSYEDCILNENIHIDWELDTYINSIHSNVHKILEVLKELQYFYLKKDCLNSLNKICVLNLSALKDVKEMIEICNSYSPFVLKNRGFDVNINEIKKISSGFHGIMRSIRHLYRISTEQLKDKVIEL